MKVLVINSSILWDRSTSRLLVREAVNAIAGLHIGATFIERDLGMTPVPHLSTATAAGITGTPVSDAEQQARALSDELIGELRAADAIVIGAPMYNFSIPTGLRAWFDHVLRSGETFRYSAEGPEGLLRQKQVLVIQSRGGVYTEGHATALDFQEPYLRQLLGMMGLTDVSFIHAERTAFGEDALAASITRAKQAIAAAVAAARPAGAAAA